MGAGSRVIFRVWVAVGAVQTKCAQKLRLGLRRGGTTSIARVPSHVVDPVFIDLYTQLCFEAERNIVFLAGQV